MKLVIEFSKGRRMTPAGAGSVMPGLPPGAIPRALSRGEGERDNHGSTCFLVHVGSGLASLTSSKMTLQAMFDHLLRSLRLRATVLCSYPPCDPLCVALKSTSATILPFF